MPSTTQILTGLLAAAPTALGAQLTQVPDYNSTATSRAQM